MTGDEAITDESAGPSPRAGAVPTAGRLVAGSGRDLINAAERLICGADAVPSAPVAEGLALAGRRAATLLESDPSMAPAGVELAAAAAWVHHRIRPGHAGLRGQVAFELVAGNAQEALDHCLVAHRLAARLGLPGVCTVDEKIARGLHLARLPTPEMPAEILNDATREVSFDGDAALILEAAREAFRHVSARTRRACRALALHGMQDADYVLVVCGASSEPALAVAGELRHEGIRCGVVTVGLMHPTPAEELFELLRGKRTIGVVEPPAPAGETGDLACSVRASLGAHGATLVRAVTVEEVRRAFDLRPATARKRAPAARSKTTGARVAVGIAAAGTDGEAFLLEAAAVVGRLGRLTLERPASAAGAAGVELIVAGADAGGPLPEKLDLLLAADRSLLADSTAIARVRAGGTVLIESRADSALSLAGQALRERLSEGSLRVSVIDTSATVGEGNGEPRTSRWMLQGALLAASDLARLAGRAGGIVEALKQLAETGQLPEDQAGLLMRGAAELRALDPSELAPAQPARTTDGPAPGPPRMPGPDERSDPAWRDTLREFHLAGEDHGPPGAEGFAAPAIRPALLDAASFSPDEYRDYPLLIPAADAASSEERASSLLERIDCALDELERSGEPAPTAREHRRRLVAVAARLLAHRPQALPADVLLREAWETLLDDLRLDSAARSAAVDEIAGLLQRLPRSASLLGLGPHTLLTLHTDSLERGRGPRLEAFAGEVRSLIARLRELLQVEETHGPRGTSPDALSGSLGRITGELLDTRSLSDSLRSQRGSRRMAGQRRARVEGSLRVLRAYLDEAAKAPPLVLVHAGDPPRHGLPPATRLVRHPDGMALAIGLFDGLAGRLVETLRAVRVARLEIQGAYAAQRHDAALERLTWESLGAEELALVPPVVVLESGERLRRRSLASFSALLHSGRPVQVLIEDRAGAPRALELRQALSGYHPGLGYVAVAHREAYVLQSALDRTRHLLSGLRRMATSLRPAVALVAVPSWGTRVAASLQLAALREGRGAPCLRYDPDAGASWAARFDLAGNSQPQRPWPVHEVCFLDSEGAEQSRPEAFTFAHAAALDAAYRGHLRVVPTVAWSEEQVELADYLEMAEDLRINRLPFIWVVDGQGGLARAVLTRDLAFAARDRMRAWRILQELAGTENEYARRAVESTRELADDDNRALREELGGAHARELERVRLQAAEQAAERLVGVLMDLDAPPSPTAATPPAQRTDPVLEPSSDEEPQAQAEAGAPPAPQPVAYEHPCIDSVLCTTCHECINLNAQMFKYNDDKQAYIADAAAGTFAQLVKAAEKCPARCIHPGVPRAGDKSATDELIARAAKFN